LNRFDKKVQHWLNDDPRWVVRQWNKVMFVWHNRMPMGFRFFGLVHWLVRFTLMASAPALAHFVYKRITLLEASYATAVLFFVFSLSSMLDAWSKRKNNTVDQASAETWIRIGDLITSVKSSATAAANKDDTITATLGVIEAYARQLTRSPKGKISVSLALYDGNSTTKMKIRHRNPGNERPTGRGLKHLERVLGHIACQAGPEPRVVTDLKAFGRDGYFSPTQSSCEYRAMALIPVKANSTEKIKGFISVDCNVPYAFSGNIIERLVVTCEPLTNHIEEQF
jgi:hypothetical protein